MLEKSINLERKLEETLEKLGSIKAVDKLTNNDKKIEIKDNYWPQYLAVFTAALSYYNRGLHSAWTSPALPKLLNGTNGTEIDSYFPISSAEGSWIVVSYSASISIGAPLAAYLIHSIGRKNTILLTALPTLLAFLLIAFAPSIECFYVARILAGISEGLANIALPVYVGEVAQAKIRGFLGSITAIFLTLGLLSVNVIGSYTTIFQTSMILSIFPILLIGTFYWMPESPYYLMMKNDINSAEQSLIKLRGTKMVQEELKLIQVTVEKQMANEGTFKALFCERSNRRALLLALAMETVLQLSGIQAILSYTQIIFIESGEHITSEMSSIMLMVIQLVASISATNFVDKLGRKPLLMISCAGCGIALMFEGLYFYLQYIGFDCLHSFSWVPLSALILYIIVYSMGLAIIINILLGEIFAANVKGKAIGINTILYGILAFFVSKLFQIMTDHVGMFVPFWIYGIFSLSAVIYIYYCVPETKGKTLDEIVEWFEKS